MLLTLALAASLTSAVLPRDTGRGTVRSDSLVSRALGVQ